MAMTAAQFVALKARCDTEWKRRAYNGSMTGYVKAFGTTPAAGGKILAAQGNLVMTPFADKMKTHGNLKTATAGTTKLSETSDFDNATIASWLTTLEGRSKTSSTNDCSGACSGLCVGCQGSCTDKCSGCTGTCSDTCSGTCTGSCSGCTGSCSGSCSGCTGSCSGSCSGCTGGCTDACTRSCSTMSGCNNCGPCSGCLGGNECKSGCKTSCSTCSGCTGYWQGRG